jgi:cobalt-zinc-cadmium efflux system protein
MLRQSIRTLMLSTPVGVDLESLAKSLCTVDGVEGVHHLHVWELDEQSRTLEAHVVIRPERAIELEAIKTAVKAVLQRAHDIGHSTLEFEVADGMNGCCDEVGLVAKH